MNINSAKKNILALTILLLLTTTATPLLINPAKAFPGDQPAIIVEPQSIKDPTLEPNTTFQIEVNLYNATTETVPNGLYGVEIKLTWNPDILELIGINFKIGEAGGVLNSPYFAAKNETTTGMYWTAVSSLPPAEPWWGDGTIIKATFKVLSRGKTGITLEFTDIVDAAATPIPHYTQSGIFDNRLTIPTAQVKINPEQIVDSSLTPCKNFTINITIQNAENLAQFSFKLEYNPQIIEATEANWTEEATPPTIDNTLGTIQGSITLSEPITGEIDIITIKFHIIETGETTLHLTEITLTDAWGDPLPYETTDGYFNNMLITRIFVYPPELIDPELGPGSPVQFEIRLENTFDLYFCSFKLAYNSEVIEYTGAIANTSLGLVKMRQAVHDGIIQINLTYYDTPINIGPQTTIVTIYFQVSGYGSSPLDLHETQLLNSELEPISHQTEDGFFMTVIRDIAILEIIPHPNKVYPNRIVEINVTVANLGGIAENFNVSLYYIPLGSTEENPIGTQQITDLPAGENLTITFLWNTTGLQPCTTHTLKAVATEVPFELNTENNILTGEQTVKIKMIGDIDGNGEIGLTDLVIIAQAFSSTPEDPGWNPDADLDNDGKIGLTDLVTCGYLYGTTC
ncbi:hypothetical protein DRO54_00320 [Candidatus Bathyarchaeota archaeon]|nr:MAG: hypothetical protein DRO54_00320 [Candidatus Bathyarchaeota archaeon]